MFNNIQKTKQAFQLRVARDGFSFVESIVYLAIVGILLTAVVSMHLTLGGTSSKLTSNILASRDRRISMGAIDYLVKNSDGLLNDLYGSCSDFDAEPPVLALYFEDDTYLPGTCVENGGAVRISVVNNKVAMTCYPNMSRNGSNNNCDTSVYEAGNVYYLNSPETNILDTSLAFSTSTSSSTANPFITVTTNLTVGVPVTSQRNLSATSTATTTTVVRDDSRYGFVVWWRMDHPTPGVATDSMGGNNTLSCFGGTAGAALVDDSLTSWDFETDNATDLCYSLYKDGAKFDKEFTIAAWVKPESSGADRLIFGDYIASQASGYGFYLDNNFPSLRIVSESGLTDYTASGSALSNGSIYHVTATYDLDDDEIVLYTYQKGVGGVETSTFSGIATLLNNETQLLISYDDPGTGGIDEAFDGLIDELRVYNRALSAEEIWALQSQGGS